jgi:hypothetical protein
MTLSCLLLADSSVAYVRHCACLLIREPHWKCSRVKTKCPYTESIKAGTKVKYECGHFSFQAQTEAFTKRSKKTRALLRSPLNELEYCIIWCFKFLWCRSTLSLGKARRQSSQQQLTVTSLAIGFSINSLGGKILNISCRSRSARSCRTMSDDGNESTNARAKEQVNHNRGA